MDERRAQEMFERAMDHLRQKDPEQLMRAENIGKHTFAQLTSEQFLETYCWVVYVSGFRYDTIKIKFPAIRKVFREFDLASLARMRSMVPVLSVFNNEKKAKYFLAGSKAIAKEGFSEFKRRLKTEGLCALEALPGIGRKTKFHLGKNIGLVDEAKPDRWLERAAAVCNSSVDELVTFLSKRNQVSRHVVDVVLWRYCVDKNLGLKSGY